MSNNSDEHLENEHRLTVGFEEWRQNYGIAQKLADYVFNLGTMVLRTVMLINGGAAVAMLAYVGQLKENGSQTTGAIEAIEAFTCGVIIIALAVLASYVCQFLYNISFNQYLKEMDEYQKKPEEAVQSADEIKQAPAPTRPEAEKHRSSKGLRYLGYFLHVIIAVMATIALWQFYSGVQKAISTF